jgi:hypothetical protein
MKSHPLRMSGKCPDCDQIFFIGTTDVPNSCTLDCANPQCGALLRVKEGRVYVFHELTHQESDGAWPKDGAGTAYVEMPAERLEDVDDVRESPESRVARGLHPEPGPHCVGCGRHLTPDEERTQLPDHDEICDACMNT